MIQLEKLSRAEKLRKDREFERSRRIHRFSMRSKRLSTERQAWMALATGLLLEEGIIVR